jgi:hypothetical protein
VTAALLAVVGSLAVLLAYSGHKAMTSDSRKTLATWGAIRWWMPLASLLVVPVATLIYWSLLQVPGFSWGWYQLLAGSPGNAVLGQSDQGGIFAVLAVLVPVFFALAVPREARAEEQVFRKGNHNRSLGVRGVRAVLFGLMHCVVGVPIAAGPALILVGVTTS